MALDYATKTKFLAAVEAKLTEAGQLYGLTMTDVDIELNIRGNRIAGQACYPRFNRKTRRMQDYRLRFNPAAIAEHYDEMVNSTIPHEVAHIACMKNIRLGHHHNAGWKRVARSLGDVNVGERCHDMNFGTATKKKKTQYEYMTSSGQKAMLGPGRHKTVQAGGSYLLRSDRSRITKVGFLKKVTIAA